MSTSHHHVRTIIILLVLIIFVGAYVGFAVSRPLPVLAVTIKQPVIPATTSPGFPWPSYGESAVGAVGYGLLDTHNSQLAVPMASTAKILTALAVLQQKPLALGTQGPTITLSDSDVAIYQQYLAQNGSVVQVTSGEQISEYQALQAMLLPSANNIADSLAIWAYGSTAAFLTAANALATTDGATSTHVVDASGFDPGSISTASDLVNLGIKAMADPVIAQIVGQSTATVPVAGEIHNVNSMLGQAGINGVKTGNTDQAGGVFVASATSTVGGKSLTVVSAIMAAPDLGTALVDNVPLIQATQAGFETSTIATVGQSFGTVSTSWGSSTKLIIANAITITRWKAAPITSSIAKIKLGKSLKVGTPVATMTLTCGGKTYATTIVSATGLAKPPLFWRMKHVL